MTFNIIRIVFDIWCHGSLVVGSIWWCAQFDSWFNWLEGLVVVVQFEVHLLDGSSD